MLTELSALKSLPKCKNLDSTKFKACAGDKIDFAKILISVLDRKENIVEKGENACYQHFLLFPQCFLKPSSSGPLKSGLVWLRVNASSLYNYTLNLKLYWSFHMEKIT